MVRYAQAVCSLCCDILYKEAKHLELSIHRDFSGTSSMELSTKLQLELGTVEFLFPLE